MNGAPPARPGASAMSEHASHPPEKKRRFSHRRLPAGRAKAACRRAGGAGTDLAPTLLDVSEAGVRLLVREALEVRAEVAVVLEALSVPRPIRRAGKVAWCVPSAEGAYCVGVAFHERLPCREVVGFARELPALA